MDEDDFEQLEKLEKNKTYNSYKARFLSNVQTKAMKPYLCFINRLESIDHKLASTGVILGAVALINLVSKNFDDAYSMISEIKNQTIQLEKNINKKK